MATTGTLCAAAARAVPPEYLSGVALHPLHPGMFVLRYESAGGGFLISRDGGKSASATPSHAFLKYGFSGQVPFTLASDGKLLIGQLDGLFSDDGAGCVGATPSLAWVADFAPHPSDPDLVFLVTTGNTKGMHAGLWQRERGGKLSALGVSEPLMASGNSFAGLVVQGLKVTARAESALGLRFVAVATRYRVQDGKMLPAPVLRISDDAGASWSERPLPDAGADKGTPRLLAVGAGAPTKIVVALELGGDTSDPIDPIYYSADEGQTFVAYLSEIKRAHAALLLPDGRFLVGARARAGGLWLADSLGAAPRKIAGHAVHCLSHHAPSGRTYMCKPHEFGLLELGSGTFCSQFQLNETRALSCATLSDAQRTAVQTQLCNGFCGPGHYASAALCAGYDDPARICGPSAHAYDQQNPDPDKRWLEPPGLAAAARCSGAPPLPVSSSSADAGALPTGGSRPGVSTADAGTTLEAGSTAAAEPAPARDAAASAQAEPAVIVLDPPAPPDDPAPARPRHARGGGCGLAPASARGLVASLIGWGVLAARGRRRKR